MKEPYVGRTLEVGKSRRVGVVAQVGSVLPTAGIKAHRAISSRRPFAGIGTQTATSDKDGCIMRHLVQPGSRSAAGRNHSALAVLRLTTRGGLYCRRLKRKDRPVFPFRMRSK